MANDLTKEEQDRVRAALKYLHIKFETWANLSKALRFEQTTLSHFANGTRPITAKAAFRLARLASISIDDLLAGAYPAVCPLCGRHSDKKLTKKGRSS